ncbi:MAG: magnesium/cobalt transporter CorA [Chloroflexi bacterium]|nr:magnesium/cobalt transporter CorA [Chloroflexota bacterium]
MIRALYHLPGKETQFDFPPDRYPEALKNPAGLLWLDFCGEGVEACEPILGGFGFHPLAIDDALAEIHSPKIDDWGTYLYLVFNYLSLENKNGLYDPAVDELDVFLGANFVVTHHDLPIPAIDETWKACQRDERHTASGADHLLYRILDNLVMNYMPVVERIDEEIDAIEDQVFSTPSRDTIERLFNLKRVLLAMRRILTPQREVLNKLARDDYKVIDRKDRVFFRDIYDHLVRLHDLNESMRDLVSGALDTYLSVINNRMNEAMKTLAVITTMFMPVSFVAAFFGMNFFLPEIPIREWMERPVFYLVLGLLVTTPFLMYHWIRRRTWI